MGMVFQQFNLFPHLTVIDNITLAPVKLKLMNEVTARKKALELLNTINLKIRRNIILMNFLEVRNKELL